MDPVDAAGICFDMDGVLVHSERHWVAHERDHILPTAAPDEDIPVAALTGRNYREVYPDLAATYDLAVSRTEFEEMFEEAAGDIYGEHATLLEGAHGLLEALRDRGSRLALTTSTPWAWLDIVDDRFDLLRHFEAVVSAETLDRPGKPAPDIYERGAAELGLAPTACLAVEDSTAGVTAATRAGCYTVGFQGDGDDADLSAADRIVGDAAALRELLLGDDTTR